MFLERVIKIDLLNLEAALKVRTQFFFLVNGKLIESNYKKIEKFFYYLVHILYNISFSTCFQI